MLCKAHFLEPPTLITCHWIMQVRCAWGDMVWGPWTLHWEQMLAFLGKQQLRNILQSSNFYITTWACCCVWKQIRSEKALMETTDWWISFALPINIQRIKTTSREIEIARVQYNVYVWLTLALKMSRPWWQMSPVFISLSIRNEEDCRRNGYISLPAGIASSYTQLNLTNDSCIIDIVFHAIAVPLK